MPGQLGGRAEKVYRDAVSIAAELADWPVGNGSLIRAAMAGKPAPHNKPAWAEPPTQPWAVGGVRAAGDGSFKLRGARAYLTMENR
jgi:hypothetical protein